MNVLILPGLGDSGPRHWQTLWEHKHPAFRRVVQQNWLAPRRDDWVAALDQAVGEVGAEVVLVAHSLACLAVAHWAAATVRGVRGALLVAVPDPDRVGFPPEAVGFTPVPMTLFGFPAVVVASTNDPYSAMPFARRCARAWGARLVNVGECGHINADSGMGEWEDGLRLLRQLGGQAVTACMARTVAARP